jgi:DNA polymerase-3 subunit alpha
MFDKIEIYDLLHPQTIPSVPVKNYPKKDEKNIIDIGLFPELERMEQSDDIYERYWVNECTQNLIKKGLHKREYWNELEEEARVKRVIGEKLGTNMFKYPITLKYYIDMIWDCGSLVGAGRGSSCAALNHYLLGITQLDPIQWKLPFFRYMNDERVELGDIDIDICPSKKGTIVKEIKKERGGRFNPDIDQLSRENLGCTLVATYGTEGSKSAVLTACRGYRHLEYPDGIDNDEAQYIASLIPSERGFLWTIDEVVNGNPEKGRKPVDLFINEVNQFPGLLDIIKGIEGLINKRSSHASGVILFDEDPYEFGAGFMKTPKGEVITQLDLHDCEASGLTKYDFLVTEVQDKLTQAIKFLQEDGCIEKDLSLREVYNKYFHPNVLPIKDERVWKAIHEGNIINIFQFDSEVGSQAAKKIKPTTILELSDANGLMRLMTSEQGAETPMEKYIRFKNNIKLWYNEMDRYGLTKEEQKTLEPYFLSSYGVPPSQEQLMTMLMDKDICNFSLKEANAARKIVGKKQMNKIPELHQSILDKAKSNALGQYVWDCGVGPQMGYSFSTIHALAYSFIGFQTAYIATNWNPIYWDTACLVVNSGSLEEDDIEYDEDDKPVKKKEIGTDYGKIAKALGEIIAAGIKVSLVDINKSDYGFKPDVENNQILFGMKALGYVGQDVVNKIKEGRPYSSLKDFMNRCYLNKTAMINLIKGGAFDNLESAWAKQVNVSPRILSMVYYLSVVSEPKKKLNLMNFNGLIEKGLIPKELDFERRVFGFNKYLKAHKQGEYYVIGDKGAADFWKEFFSLDDIAKIQNGYGFIEQKFWDKQYASIMNKARDYIKLHQDELLKVYNTILFKEQWEKYAQGNISSWEMEALCFYYHEHELANIDFTKYGIRDFFTLSPEPEVDYFFKRNGKQIPIYKLCRVAGTVIGKNDTRHSVILLTTTGVVNVKFTRDYYALFNRQLSEKDEDGTKHVKEKGWFTRGTKLLVTGYRRDDTFVSKKYKATGGHQLYKITDVSGRNINITSERYGVNENEQ